jgi:type II secretion system protein L
LYLQRDGLHDGQSCPWALIGRDGRVARSGATLADAPRADVRRLVVEADRVVTFAADLPALPARRLAPLLANAVEAASLDEAEDLHVVLAGRDARGKALCATLSAPWLERLLARLAERDIYPDAAVSEGMLVPWEAHTWSLVLNEGSTLIRLDEARALSVDASDPPVGLTLALAREGAPRRLRVYKGNRLRMPDLAAWRAQLGMDIVEAGDWDWRAAPWTDTGNLLTGRFAARRAGMDLRGALKPLLWGALALAGIQGVGLGVDTYLLHREQGTLRDAQQRLARRVLPAQAAVVDPAWQVAEAHARMQARASGDPDGMLALMARLGAVWPNEPGPRTRRVSYADGTLEVQLASRQDAWLARLTGAAATAGLDIKVAGQGQDVSLRLSPAPKGGQHGR